MRLRIGLLMRYAKRGTQGSAVLLFGGNGYTTTGQGEIAERIYREVMGVRIPGGSEDVMLDLAIRQLLRNFQSAGGGRESGAAKL